MRLVSIYYSSKLEEINLTYLNQEGILLVSENDKLSADTYQDIDWILDYLKYFEFQLIGYFMEEL
jgi:hypothetical protein